MLFGCRSRQANSVHTSRQAHAAYSVRLKQTLMLQGSLSGAVSYLRRQRPSSSPQPKLPCVHDWLGRIPAVRPPAALTAHSPALDPSRSPASGIFLEPVSVPSLVCSKRQRRHALPDTYPLLRPSSRFKIPIQEILFCEVSESILLSRFAASWELRQTTNARWSPVSHPPAPWRSTSATCPHPSMTCR